MFNQAQGATHMSLAESVASVARRATDGLIEIFSPAPPEGATVELVAAPHEWLPPHAAEKFRGIVGRAARAADAAYASAQALNAAIKAKALLEAELATLLKPASAGG